MPKKLTLQEYISRVNKIHNNKYDYSLITEYKNLEQKIPIKCPEGHVFIKKADHHLHLKQGCSICSKGLPYFLKKAKKVHGEEYDYSKVVYEGHMAPVIIHHKICKQDFKQQPNNHLAGQRCPHCFKAPRITLQTFIERSKSLNPDMYDYSITVYNNLDETVELICKQCNQKFITTPRTHLYDNSNCNCYKFKSKLEAQYQKFLKTFNFRLISNSRPSFMLGLELDIYIPDLRLAIELNGESSHHSNRVENEFLNSRVKDKNYHLKKYNLCKENNIDLIHIFYFEDHSNWFTLLNEILNNREKYIITFKNSKRSFPYYKHILNYYGQSFIEKL